MHSLNQVIFSDGEYMDSLFPVYLTIFQQLTTLVSSFCLFNSHSNTPLIQPVLSLFFSSIGKLTLSQGHDDMHQ